jgi:hypothetical protein
MQLIQKLVQPNVATVVPLSVVVVHLKGTTIVPFVWLLFL